MSEQLLDRPQVGPALEQVRGEGVSQPVRVRNEPAQCARVEPPAAGGEEERVLRAARELGPAVAQIAREPVRRLLPERDDAVLRALAAPDAHELLLEVDVAEVEADRLGAAQPGGVDELDERAIAERDRTLSLEPREEALHLCRPRRVRQATRGAWGECGVRHARRPEGVTQEGAHGGELAADRRRGELGRPPAGTRGAQVRCIVDERADVDVVELRLAPLQPAAELVDVVAIGTPRALRERRRVEKACSGRVGVHGPEFDTRPAQPAPEPAVLAR